MRLGYQLSRQDCDPGHPRRTLAQGWLHLEWRSVPAARVPVISTSHPFERRSGRERRERTLHALLSGHWIRRRRGGRRSDDAHPVLRDWHDPRWLGVTVLVLLLSITDAFMTLTLLRHGAQEINPFMAPLIEGGGPSFAYWKLGLTSFGALVLTAFAHVRLFGRIPAGCLLYLVLLGYVVLVAYEWHLLQQIGTNFVSSRLVHPLH